MKYQLGADGTSAIDCSQLVVESLKQAGAVGSGFDTTAAGFHSVTKPKKAHEVQRGDFVFLKNGSNITHIEIATGPAVNGVIPIIDASGRSNAGKVAYREQRIDSHVLVGTPTFYA
ncbi:MAG: NlpC/P60 family protein [Patescibacteria group bacterium]